MRALRIGVLAAAAAGLFTAAPAAAFDECIRTCAATAKDCLFDSHEEHQMCLEDFGCDVLRAEFREMCFTADPDREACHAARQDLVACMGPCRVDLRDDVRVCKDDAMSCIENTCEENPFARFLRRYKKP